TLDAASDQTVTIHYSTADNTATAGSDYTATSGTLTFAPGVTSQPITVAVIGDRVGELDESFFVNLDSPVNANLIDSQGVGTIVNDSRGISTRDVPPNEGNRKPTNFNFVVPLPSP